MPRYLARRVARNVYRKPAPANGTQFRNRVNQAASKYRITEQRVHTALFMCSHAPHRS